MLLQEPMEVTYYIMFSEGKRKARPSESDLRLTFRVALLLIPFISLIDAL